MKCPNKECKSFIDTPENMEANFDYCKECGTIVYRFKRKK